ncbi:MAG TPA: DUF4870 domain-containing protein [Steroidobacteraceae bacterium]|nr:DUF4870 domain-containing protein [Steroidobacteraceae bacterium]
MSTSDSPSSAPQALSADDRTWGMIAHFSALAFFVLPALGAAIGPLVVWAIKREQSAFASEAAKEALNFNITVLLAYCVCGLLVFVFIGILLGAALFIAWLVLTIVAGIKASEGVHYRYPVALRLIK